MSADTTPEAVAERVAEWRIHGERYGLTRHAEPDGGGGALLLLDACDLIEALAAERDTARADAALSLRQRQSLSTANMASEELRQRAEVERDDAIARAERAEAALRDDTAAQYRAAFAADAAARARLAADRAGIPPTERDRRGVPLGTGAGVGGADL